MLGYVVFVGLNVAGVELSFQVTLIVTLLALACLVVFWVSAIPTADFNRWALNIGVGPDGAAVELPDGNGPFLPFGITGALAALPFAVWLFLAIEQLAARGRGDRSIRSTTCRRASSSACSR